MAIKRSSCVLRLSDFWRNPLVILKCIVTRKEFLGQEKEEAMPNSLFFQILDPLLQLRIRHFRSRKTIILTWKIYNYQTAKLRENCGKQKSLCLSFWCLFLLLFIQNSDRNMIQGTRTRLRVNLFGHRKQFLENFSSLEDAWA